MSDDPIKIDDSTRSGNTPSALRFAREAALQVLYCIDMQRDWFLETQTLDTLWEQAREGMPEDWNNEQQRRVQRFAYKLIEGVLNKREEVDSILAKYAEHWSVERMTAIDRSILRMAAFELLFEENVPPKTAVNEAIEMAKKFGDKDSGRFINGLLDRVMRSELNST